MTKSLLISGVRSGCGKTSLTLGLLAALTRRGLVCAPFKTGPDFIDPGLHALACGRESHNMDSWMLTAEANRSIFSRHAAGADVAVAEGAMGLFDGASGSSERGSAAHMAKLLGIPAVLVVDASGMGRSAAAVAQGFARFDPSLSLAGVVFNRVGGRGHREILAEAMAQAGMQVLGMLGRDAKLAIPSRHLGLTTAADLEDCPAWLDKLACWVEDGIDLDRLVGLLPETMLDATAPVQDAPPAVRLGVARDRAFCFLYGENLRLLRAAGAEPVFFSPLEDSRLPDGLDGLYLPGGYPEMHAGALSANASMLADLRSFCLSGRPALAECGGFMTLMEGFTDLEGRFHAMAGVFPCSARMGTRFAALGYREAVFQAATPLGPPGTVARGHEFHYSSLEALPEVSSAYSLSGRTGPIDTPEGFLAAGTLGSYVHLHFASNPELARNFVASMLKARTEA
ncbi:MAG: cobyrinate a,c-diamide synthase [Thermodesulfobacteriota bacterium]